MKAPKDESKLWRSNNSQQDLGYINQISEAK